jgi:uncharacterized protein YndB with AHSA1/START domain
VNATKEEKIVTVRRTVRGGRAFLFSAWTEPELFARWFGPKTWTVERCELDRRVGGRWRAWFRRGDGGSVSVGGTYLAIEAPERLVFTWDTDPDGQNTELQSVVTVSFTAAPKGVEIEITHRKLGSAEAVDMDAGWNNTLDALEAFLSTVTEEI